ncbi:MAG: non-canonical purine NTP pyrophosphatase, partial [Syntrophomonadaceae bacterium]|nr:non-canonical purine NTP pyrophosphatase [Syntrophomonadaceae bacterium]
MERRLVLATRNRKKRAELEAILAPLGLRVHTLDEFPEVPEVVEDGATFEANARKKARAVAEATGLVALADDSGLEVDALGGLPGV